MAIRSFSIKGFAQKPILIIHRNSYKSVISEAAPSKEIFAF